MLAVVLAGPWFAAAQTGQVTEVLKDCRARVKWDADGPMPMAGRLGFVTGQNRVLAVFRTLDPGESGGEILLQDVLWPGFLLKDQQARVTETEMSPAPAGKGALLVWSDHPGGGIQVNGSPAGHAPAWVILDPGTHEILLDLPEGGKAGARIHARAGVEDFLCLHGRSWPDPEGMGIPFLLLSPDLKKKEGRPEPLRWLEDREGNRVYFCNDTVKHPVVRNKAIPRYPEAARRLRRQGKVILDGLVGSDGRIANLDVIFSPGDDFSQAAVEAVSQWTYEPATLDGKPVNVYFTITAEFYLTH